MKGYNEAICNAAIKALMAAYHNLMQTTIREALGTTPYGKTDTLALDAIPEIEIIAQITHFDPECIMVTEELGRKAAEEWPAHCSPKDQPVIFFCDPTDRSLFLKKFLEIFKSDKASSEIGEIIADPENRKRWDDIGGTPCSITGATSAITCLHRGVVTFSLILNYISQEIFLACSAGIYQYGLLDADNKRIGDDLTVKKIISDGTPIVFPCIDGDQKWKNWKKYVTFLGKSGYKENFDDSMIFVEKGDQYLHHDQPGGPSRVLYLSNLQTLEKPIGFILSNGEKISEWIHWLPFVRYAHTTGERSLILFEIYHDRPWTKKGILMSTSEPYSIFQPSKTEEGVMIIDVNQLARFENPSFFRSTLVIAERHNQWALHTMRQHQYREIILPPGTMI